jgi:hypothetical protein
MRSGARTSEIGSSFFAHFSGRFFELACDESPGREFYSYRTGSPRHSGAITSEVRGLARLVTEAAHELSLLENLAFHCGLEIVSRRALLK